MKRRASFAILIMLLVFTAVKCVPEHKVDLATKITPIEWLNERELLVRIDNDYFIRDQSGTLEPSTFDAASSLYDNSLPPEITPPSTVQFWSEEVYSGETHVRTSQYIEIEGSKHEVQKSRRPLRNLGINQGFPMNAQSIQFYTYLHDEKIGLLTFDNGTVQKINLPLQDSSNLTSPAVIRDRNSNMFLAFQVSCSREDADGICTRTAWWINAELEVISSFLLPRNDPLFTQEKWACFSCGCGCYTREDVYAIDGQVYFQFSGWPISTSKRGLYRVVGAETGSAEWRQEIKGRIEPPLAFSPSGCQVAYFKVSLFRESLETRNLCD